MTVNAQDDVAQAVAVFGGRIIAVGSSTDVGWLIGPQTEVIRLSGQTCR